VSIKNETLVEKLFSSQALKKDLTEYQVEEVFDKLLDDYKLTDEAKTELRSTFNEILLSLETEESGENIDSGDALRPALADKNI
jgi:hypothetical protein